MELSVTNLDGSIIDYNIALEQANYAVLSFDTSNVVHINLVRGHYAHISSTTMPVTVQVESVLTKLSTISRLREALIASLQSKFATLSLTELGTNTQIQGRYVPSSLEIVDAARDTEDTVSLLCQQKAVFTFKGELL